MLSEEEKKAINSLKNEYKKLEEEGNILFPLFKQQAKTILNLITKLQKENEELTTALSKQSKDIGNYLVELQQKDKQIDLMAGYISNLDIDEDICKEQSDNNCDDINREADCKDCIKQYFEKLTKENKNET